MEYRLVQSKLIENSIAVFRDERTSPYECNKSVENICFILANEVSTFLPSEAVKIATPLGIADGEVLSGNILLVPIMRAGYAMVPAFWRMFQGAKVCPIWLSRNKDLSIETHHHKLFSNLGDYSVIVLDTVLATGGTANTAIEMATKNGARNIVFSSVLSTKMGIDSILKKGEAHIVTACERDTLDEHFYVYPGVGDSGDRLFGV